jgi:hemolysin III
MYNGGAMQPPPYSFREEVANSISHGFGLVLALVALPILVLAAIEIGNVRFLIGVSVFGGTMVLLYLASTLYHSISHEAAKQLFRIFDHTAIFLLIAGSYTPFSLGVLHGPWGWSMLAIVWTLAIIGITLKIRKRTRHSRISIVLYVIMGWLAEVAVKPMVMLIPVPGILLIFAGGLAYTGGLVFFGAQRIRYNHFIWHLFVLAGTTCHFFAVLWYAA